MVVSFVLFDPPVIVFYPSSLCLTEGRSGHFASKRRFFSSKRFFLLRGLLVWHRRVCSMQLSNTLISYFIVRMSLKYWSVAR